MSSGGKISYACIVKVSISPGGNRDNRPRKDHINCKIIADAGHTNLDRVIKPLIYRLSDTWSQDSVRREIAPPSQSIVPGLGENKTRRGVYHSDCDMDENRIYYLIQEGRCYLCVCTQDFPQRISFAFLQHIVDEAAKGSQLSRMLEEQLVYFSEDPSADKIRKLQSRVEEISLIMQNNMGLMLSREESNQVLRTKAEEMREKSVTFKRKARKSRWRLFWRRLLRCGFG